MAVEILAAQDLDDDDEEEEDLDKSRQADEKEDLQAGRQASKVECSENAKDLG